MAFVKGHKNEYLGKKISKTKFLYAMNEYRDLRMTIGEASEYIGLSPITALKRFGEYAIYGDLPSYLWEKE